MSYRYSCLHVQPRTASSSLPASSFPSWSSQRFSLVCCEVPRTSQYSMWHGCRTPARTLCSASLPVSSSLSSLSVLPAPFWCMLWWELLQACPPSSSCWCCSAHCWAAAPATAAMSGTFPAAGTKRRRTRREPVAVSQCPLPRLLVSSCCPALLNFSCKHLSCSPPSDNAPTSPHSSSTIACAVVSPPACCSWNGRLLLWSVLVAFPVTLPSTPSDSDSDSNGATARGGGGGRGKGLCRHASTSCKIRARVM